MAPSGFTNNDLDFVAQAPRRIQTRLTIECSSSLVPLFAEKYR